MPIFIYGMYEDSNGELHASVYVSQSISSWPPVSLTA